MNYLISRDFLIHEPDYIPGSQNDRVFPVGLQQIQAIAPVKLVKLEFAVQEEKFLGLVENAEKTINQQQQKLQRRDNVKETLLKHKVLC